MVDCPESRSRVGVRETDFDGSEVGFDILLVVFITIWEVLERVLPIWAAAIVVSSREGGGRWTGVNEHQTDCGPRADCSWLRQGV